MPYQKIDKKPPKSRNYYIRHWVFGTVSFIWAGSFVCSCCLLLKEQMPETTRESQVHIAL